MSWVTLVLFLCSAPALAAPLDPDTEVAHRHHDAGVILYRAGDYAGALVEFERARLAKPLPELDYNLARCLDRLERWEEAADAYERYADSRPVDEAEVRDRARVLRGRLAPVAILGTPLPPAMRSIPAIPLGALTMPAPVPPPVGRWRWWTIGGGAVAVVGGVAVGLGLGIGLRRGDRPAIAATDGSYTARFP